MITAEQKQRIRDVYERPFHYDVYGQMIFDAKNRQVVDIRGWGHLQYQKDGSEIQDNLGRLITEFLNAF